VASAGDDQNITLWGIEKEQLQKVMKGHNAWVYSLAWSQDCCVLASDSRDKSVRLWDVTTADSLRRSVRLHAQHKSEVFSAEDDVEGDGDLPSTEVASPTNAKKSGFFSRAFGNVTHKLGNVREHTTDTISDKIMVVQDKILEAIDDVGEMVGNRFEVIGELAESAQEKMSMAKDLAKSTVVAAKDTAASAVDHFHIAAEVAADKMDILKCHMDVMIHSALEKVKKSAKH